VSTCRVAGDDDTRLSDEAFVSSLTAGDNQAPFTQPWELRSFAIAVAAHQAGMLEWPEFQGSLIASIEQWEREHGDSRESWNYYEHWVTALESVLARNGALESDALQERTKAVLRLPRQVSYHPASRTPVAIDPARA
jgi:nitrile hydratase accessory protein